MDYAKGGAGETHVYPSESIERRWLTLKAAAAYINRTDWAIRALIKRGKIRAEKPDGRIAIDVQELDRFMRGAVA